MMGTKPDEDIRRPLQWSDKATSAGFSDGEPWRPPFEDYPERNIENQTEDPDSLLSHYRQLIHLRSNHETLRIGDWTLVETRPGKLLAFLRQSDDESILVLINPNKQTIDDYGLALVESNLPQEAKAALLFGEGDIVSPVIDDQGTFTDYRPFETIPPQSTSVIQLSP